MWLPADLRVIGAERIPARGGVLPGRPRGRPVDCGRRKVRFLALADLFDHPLVGWVLRGTRMLLEQH